jgi:predicted ATPase/DNA-binding SARP family transcriptional activator
VEFRILGPLEVLAGADPAALGAGRGRLVLAALLLRAGEPVPDDVLVEVLWGEEARAGARSALQVQISRLRARLGAAAERLVTTPAGYRLDVAWDELDASRFEALCARARREEPAAAAATLTEALALWRGPALADVRYESFAQAEIGRLEELRWGALEDRLEAELALGRDAAVVAELERLAAEAPLRERLVEQRMRALYRAGRHVDALAVFREARRRLDEELGLEPGPALRALEQAILAHDQSLVVSHAPGRTMPPVPPTPTVGRERELEALVRALSESRLVTLIGPGGVGKTRVAVEGARALAERYSGGVHVAWLAPVADAADVPAALAAAVEVVAPPGERPRDALVRRLGGAASLLMVDNLEHVLTAGPLLAELLAGCPQLRILATSREPLRLRGERCLPVPPLADSDAIELFVGRARDRRPDFRLTDVNASAVAELCRRLDGLPLALELAAARIGLLEPQQLVARLGDALPLLAGGPQDAPRRQQTIRATLEWSVALLDEEERRAFLALAVFTGGAELDVAERVTEAPLPVLDALVAKSLVRLQNGRLSLLEVVRQFAAAALADSRWGDAARGRHADWCLELAERLGPEVRVHGYGAALRRLDRELGNLRAALQWLLERGDGERSLRMAAALEPYWGVRNGAREGVRALNAALAVGQVASARARGRARLSRSELMWWNRDQQREDARAALALAQTSDDLEGQCMALDQLAALAALEADFASAIEIARRQRAVAEQLDDPYQIAMALKRQAFAEPGLLEARAYAEQAAARLRDCGSVHRIVELTMSVVMVALTEEDYDAAEELAGQGVRAAEEADNPLGMAAALGNAGLAALFLGRIDIAERRFRDQLAIYRRERIEKRWAEPALGLAAVAARTGDAERAATLLGASDAPLWQFVGEADRPVYENLIAQFIAPARAALGDAAWQRAEAAGHTLTPQDIFDLALGDDILTFGAGASHQTG